MVLKQAIKISPEYDHSEFLSIIQDKITTNLIYTKILNLIRNKP